MHSADYTLIPIVFLTRSCREDPVLEEERLVPRQPLFDELSLPGLVLSPEAVLMKDGIKLPLGLGRDVMIKVLIPVGDVLTNVNLAGVDCAGEQVIAVVKDNVALIV